jgi:hypothetical protein
MLSSHDPNLKKSVFVVRIVVQLNSYFCSRDCIPVRFELSKGASNDWISLVVKYSSKCRTCSKAIFKGENAVWSRSTQSIKHIECHSRDLESLTSPDSIHNMQLKCAICNRPAGCPECEFEQDCDRMKVSQLCICEKCYLDENALQMYHHAVSDLLFRADSSKRNWS